MRNSGLDPVLANIFDFVWLIVRLALVSVWILAKGLAGLIVKIVNSIAVVQHIGE